MDPDDEWEERDPGTHCGFCDVVLGSWDDEDPDGLACNDCYQYYCAENDD